MRTEPRADAQTVDTHRSVLGDIRSLGALREELRLQAHLLRAEARARFERLERTWMELERVGRAIEEESTEAAKRFAHAGRQMSRDLRDEYRRLEGGLARPN